MTEGSWSAARAERGYPQALHDLGDQAPERIWGTGSWQLVQTLEPDRAVTIVGSRRSGGYGRAIARDLGFGAASAGLAVVSGLALGCDSAAHEGALDANGQTVAVLAGGPDFAQPRSRGCLYRRILATGGAVISEHPPGTQPHAGLFPLRNRIMAALAANVVVVEGAIRSGTRSTADTANDLGRNLCAVPGPVTSAFSALPNQLLKDGAHLIRDAQDLLDIGLGPGAVSVRGVGPALDRALLAVLHAVEDGAATCDAVAERAADGVSSVPVALARLELMGYVRADPMGRYSRTMLAVPDGDGAVALASGA